MPKFEKPDNINIIWGTSALEIDISKPENSKIRQGWIQEKPPYQWENWLIREITKALAYQNQMGIPEWDENTEYQAGKSYVQGADGRIYKARTTNTGNNPSNNANPSDWKQYSGERRATTDDTGVTKLATQEQVNDEQNDEDTVTPSTLGGWADQVTRFLRRDQNLSDLPDKSASRGNLGLGTASTYSADQFMRRDADAINESGKIRIRDDGNRNVYFEDQNGNEQALIYHSNTNEELRIRLRNGGGSTLSQLSLEGNGDISASVGQLAGDGSGLYSVDAITLDGEYSGYYEDIPSRLGFTPVQQGGGDGQGSNKIYIGWDNSSNLKVQVDNSDMGSIWTDDSAYENYATSGYAGNIGTYAFLESNNHRTSPGENRSSSALRWSNSSTGYDWNWGEQLSGTWRCMGTTRDGGQDGDDATLWLRIA